jgi:hypothetical protein
MSLGRTIGAPEPSPTAGLAVPREFKDGFGWTTVLGVFFCGLVMMPGGIYLGLMTGLGRSPTLSRIA